MTCQANGVARSGARFDPAPGKSLLALRCSEWHRAELADLAVETRAADAVVQGVIVLRVRVDVTSTLAPGADRAPSGCFFAIDDSQQALPPAQVSGSRHGGLAHRPTSRITHVWRFDDTSRIVWWKIRSPNQRIRASGFATASPNVRYMGYSRRAARVWPRAPTRPAAARRRRMRREN
jgi:hypothetical protein